MQWVAIVAEFIGLALIALELYLPRSSTQLGDALEGSRPALSAASEERRMQIAIALYVGAWICGAIAVALWDPAMSIAFNVGLTVFSVLVALLVGLFRTLVRLGILLGRGNSLGGIGLLMALLGFSLEVTQLL